MNLFSRKSYAIIFIIGLIFGLLGLTISTFMRHMFFSLLSSLLFGFIWKMVEYLIKKRWRRLLPMMVFLLAVFVLPIAILGSGSSISCFGYSERVYEHDFTGQKEAKRVPCNSTGPAWYWNKVNVSVEECRESENCKTGKFVDSQSPEEQIQRLKEKKNNS